jgi:aspartate carbamoyltransferase regulatory subunit
VTEKHDDKHQPQAEGKTKPQTEGKAVHGADDEQLRVNKIENGIVLDHLPPGSALKVLDALGVTAEFPGTVSILMKSPSSRHGLKDLVKIEGKALGKTELDRAALLAPHSTVNVIKGFKVVEKYRVSVADEVKDVVRCPNNKCVTNAEGKSIFRVEERNPLKLRCAYCERLYHAAELASPAHAQG